MSDVDIVSEIEEIEEFMNKLASGVMPLTAALAVHWTPHRLAELMKDDGFRELAQFATERRIEAVEGKAFELAMRGNTTMIQFVLLSQASDRGWRPPTQRVAVNTTSEIKVEHVLTQKEALLQIIQERGITALQPAQDAIEVSSTVDE